MMMTVLPSMRRLIWISVGLMLIHLILTWGVTGHIDQLVLNGLFWGAIAFRLWQRRQTLVLRSDRPYRFLGIALCSGVLVSSLMAVHLGSAFVRLFPGFAALSIGLIASGRHLKQYWQEGILVLMIMVPQGLVSQWIEGWVGLPVQTLVAQWAAFLLHYLGQEVTRQGIEVLLPAGAVEVQYACTGVPILLLLLQLSVLLLILFPVHPIKRCLMGMTAGAIALILSSARVALMAVVVHHPDQFSYWHGSQGSQIFSTLAIVLFVLMFQPELGDRH